MIKLIGSLAKIMHYYFAMPLLTVATWFQIVGILLIIITIIKKGVENKKCFCTL